MKNWFRRKWAAITSWLFTDSSSARYLPSRIDDIPETPRENTFYLVGEEPYVWCGVMLCPCGCRETISLNLLPEGQPRWNYKILRDGSITIYPSIWRIKNCRSHFFLQRGKICWVKN